MTWISVAVVAAARSTAIAVGKMRPTGRVYFPAPFAADKNIALAVEVFDNGSYGAPLTGEPQLSKPAVDYLGVVTAGSLLVDEVKKASTGNGMLYAYGAAGLTGITIYVEVE